MNETDSVRSPRSFRWLLYLAPLLIVAGLAAAVLIGSVRSASPSFHGTAYVPAEPAPDFHLIDDAGNQVSLEDYRGRTVLLFFGYTNCPDICPLTLSKLDRVLTGLGVGPDRARVLMVTVDPERDTPAVLARFVSHFGPSVTGLTGPPADLANLASAYGVNASHSPDPDGGSMTHTAAIFGIDAQGRLRVLMRPDTPDQDLADDITALLSS